MKGFRHHGIIEKVSKGQVWVKVERTSACSSCAATQYCAASGSKKESIPITDTSRNWRVGEEVWVSLSFSRARRAVFLAYLFPLALLILILLVLLFYGTGELLAGFLSVLSLAIYFAILYQFKEKLHRKSHFSMTLKKIE